MTESIERMALRLDRDHLQLDSCARIQRSDLHGGPRRRFVGKDSLYTALNFAKSSKVVM